MLRPDPFLFLVSTIVVLWNVGILVFRRRQAGPSSGIIVPTRAMRILADVSFALSIGVVVYGVVGIVVD